MCFKNSKIKDTLTESKPNICASLVGHSATQNAELEKPWPDPSGLFSVAAIFNSGHTLLLNYAIPFHRPSF